MRVLITLLFLTVAAHAQEIVINNGIPRNAADARYVLRNPYYDGSQSVTVASATVTGSSFSVGGSTLVVANGNTGIGTGASAGLTDKLRVYSPGTDARIWLGNATSGETGADGIILQMAGLNSALYNYENGSLSFATNNDIKMSILADGNVGIGTTAPSSKLHVNGDETVEGTSTIKGNAFSIGGSTLVVAGGKVGIGVSSPLYPVQIQLPNSPLGGLYNTREGLFVGATDQVGINVGGALSLGGSYNGAAGTNIITLARIHGNHETGTAGTTDGYLAFETIRNAGNVLVEGMRLTSASRLGLGTTSPDQKLTVAGNISLTGQVISSGTGSNYFAGNVGIGTTAPTAVLTVQAPTTATDYIVKVSSNNTDTILYARQNGHIGVGGGIPTLGTCLNATISALSNDNAGTINFTGANSSCAIVWSVARTNTPVCVVSAAAANATEGAILSAQSASGFSVTPNTGAWDNGDAVNYICLGVK